MSSAEFEELIMNHLPDHPGDYETVMVRCGFQYKNIIAAIKDICLEIEYCYGISYEAKPYLTKSRKLEVETKIIEIQSSGPAPSFDEVKTIVRDEMSAQQINANNIAKQLSCASVIKLFGELAPEPSDDYVRRLLQDLEMYLVRPSGLTSDQFESATQFKILY
ncbi:MAG: hypothetical protein EZS28_001460 [Streblomastix strix]|uniref:Uncharacterized protein n=1 Tax=Streblomastix strix TaxID=222440 RepID=A0A5J4X751_9EUKA|nr:MAG: hypothetical protein EZS28_001460 [Streblomastix strix]